MRELQFRNFIILKTFLKEFRSRGDDQSRGQYIASAKIRIANAVQKRASGRNQVRIEQLQEREIQDKSGRVPLLDNVHHGSA